MAAFMPRDSLQSPRFAQIATFMRLPHQPSATGLDIALLGIPFDGATSYRPGSRFAPREIRTHSSLIRPHHPILRVSPFEVLNVADMGDVDVNPMDVRDTFERVERVIGSILLAGAIPICVGGDHSLSLPILRAVARLAGPVGMLHIDAHQDMWDESFGNRYYHGTPFRRAVEERLLDPARVLQIGIRGPVYGADDFEFGRRHGVQTVTAEELLTRGPNVAIQRIRALGPGPLHLSFDIDGIDPAFAPGTGTPEVAGLTSRDALALVRALAGLQVVSADLVEVSPPFDPSGITSLLAANVLFEMVSVLALNRLGRAQAQ